MEEAVSEADDLLYGMPAIAEAFGWKQRQANHLKDHHGLPTFKIGRTVVAKRSAIRRWITEQEAAALAARAQFPKGL